MKKRYGLALAVSLVVAVVAGPQAALAVAPANDDRGSATAVVGADLPYSDSVDTSDATPQGNDPECVGDPDTNPTVWYAFTPSSNGTYGASTYGSDYDTTLWVGTANGGLNEIACNDDAIDVQSVVIWDATAGTQYLIMVGSCCGSPGGSLEFRIEKDPVQTTIDLSVASKGTFDKSSAAIIRGSLQCTSGPVFVEVGVSQRAGRVIIRGFGGDEVGCGDDWTITVPGENGLFKGGNAQVDAFAYGGECGPFGCTFGEAHRTVKLSGKRN